MDIVEQLRKYQCPENKGCNPVVEYCKCALMDSGADEIERLREVVMLLVAYEEHDDDIQKGAVMWDVLIEAAHAALKEEECDAEQSDDGQPTEQQEWRDFDPDC